MSTTTPSSIGDRFGEVLEQLKRERKIKQQGSIAVNTGYTVATLSEIKAGRMQLPDKVITYLQAKFNVNPDYLIRGEGPMFGSTPKREGQYGKKFKLKNNKPAFGGGGGKPRAGNESFALSYAKDLVVADKAAFKDILPLADKLYTWLESKKQP